MSIPTLRMVFGDTLTTWQRVGVALITGVAVGGGVGTAIGLRTDSDGKRVHSDNDIAAIVVLSVIVGAALGGAGWYYWEGKVQGIGSPPS